MDNSTKQGFSIVLCTYNGRGRLEPTLTHIAGLAIPDGIEVELLFVDNASTDDTVGFTLDIWEKLGAPFPMHVIEEQRPGKGYAVETGYDTAQYSYILTVDDDNWLEHDYLDQAKIILSSNPDVGVLQGHSTGNFESQPPEWFEEFKHYFIIGSPIENAGYFPANNFFVWGAGMIIRQTDWVYLRGLGFVFLTSKIPGKAAGEDNETALALLLLGRKIYYSDKLKYQHYMPSDRITWSKLRSNFETFGYVSHYLFLYAIAIDSCKKGYSIRDINIYNKFKNLMPTMRYFTYKQHLYYWVRPVEESYQLKLIQYYSHYKWFFKLSSSALRDIKLLRNWIIPLLEKSPDEFEWPYKMFKD